MGRLSRGEYRYKLVVVVRSDLKMSKGKLAVQVAHAAVTAFYELLRERPEEARMWLEEGQPKIVCKVGSEAELMKLLERARELGLKGVVIRDAGLTELPPGTITCIGLGPAPRELLDRVTGSLPLL